MVVCLFMLSVCMCVCVCFIVLCYALLYHIVLCCVAFGVVLRCFCLAFYLTHFYHIFTYFFQTCKSISQDVAKSPESVAFSV